MKPSKWIGITLTILSLFFGIGLFLGYAPRTSSIILLANAIFGFFMWGSK